MGTHVAHVTRDSDTAFKSKVVSEMTYTVSSGTLNSTIPYHQGQKVKDELAGRIYCGGLAYIVNIH